MSSSTRERAVRFPILLGRKRSEEQSKPISSTDEEAMARLRRRDSSALGLLFDRYSKLVFSVGVQVLRDAGEAEDVVQEVFTYLYQKAELFDAKKGSAKSWIVRIAYHRALDRRAYLKKRSFYTGTDINSLGDTLRGVTDLERQIVAKLDRQQLRHAFEELSVKQRRTLELFFFEGREFGEIAESFNEPLGNIRHHYYRGLDRLRKNIFLTRLRER